METAREPGHGVEVDTAETGFLSSAQQTRWNSSREPRPRLPVMERQETPPFFINLPASAESWSPIKENFSIKGGKVYQHCTKWGKIQENKCIVKKGGTGRLKLCYEKRKVDLKNKNKWKIKSLLGLVNVKLLVASARFFFREGDIGGRLVTWGARRVK